MKKMKGGAEIENKKSDIVKEERRGKEKGSDD